MAPDEMAAARRLIEAQRQYYDVRAPDYADAGLPPDRRRPGLLGAAAARRLVEVSQGGLPTARRTLADGRTFEIVKVFWRPRDLEGRLRALGWHAEVRSEGRSFLFGTANC